MGTSETLRSVIDAGRNGKRLDELTTARVIGKAAERLHAAQQLAGPGKAVGPITPNAIAIAADGTVTLELDKRGSTLAYSAPEVVSGAAGDRRSDVFSLGCVMWEALTHQRLFDAMNEAAVKAAVVEREIKAPSELNANIPAELSAMCMKALSRSPADRYASAKVMGVEIEEFLEEAGYEDSNAKVAQFVVAMKQKPMPSIVKADEKKPAPAEPSTLKSPPASGGVALAQKLSAAETKPVPAPPILPATAKPVEAADPAATPSTLAASLPPLESVAAFAPPPAAPAPAPAELPRAVGKATIAAVVPPMVSAGSTISAAVPPMVPATATIPDGAPAIKEAPIVTEPAKSDSAAPEKSSAEGSAPHAANPVDVVSLPRRSHRDSEQVLNKWAWQTDSTEAIQDDEDFHKPPSRRPLYYAIGAGCGVALIVSIIALVGGGSKNDKKPAQTAAKQTTAEQAPAPAPALEPAAAPPAGSAETPLAAEPPKAEPPPPEPAKQEPPPPEPAKQEPPPPEPAKAAKTEPPKAEPPKAEPPKVAKAEPPKTAPPKTPARTDAPKVAAKSAPLPKTEPAKTEPAKAAPKADVEASYKQGLMQFARGDTQGALASLRTSLAANPNYAPTWRGLGLVFEKLGEKDQARAAFKRYLQLAPSASDTEQIKNRMERLGS